MFITLKVRQTKKKTKSTWSPENCQKPVESLSGKNELITQGFADSAEVNGFIMAGRVIRPEERPQEPVYKSTKARNQKYKKNNNNNE